MNDNNPSVTTVKRKSTIKKILLITVAAVAVLLITVWLAAEIYMDHMLDMISYDISEGSDTVTAPDNDWSGVNIDDFSEYDPYGEASGNVSEESIYDPEADVSDVFAEDVSDDVSQDGGADNGTSGGSSGSSDKKPVSVDPDYTILENLFDDTPYSDAYDADVINILLIGADTTSGKSARSDTMILMSINNTKKRIVFTSFMRDTYVSIEGYQNNRLNAAYAAGGPKLLMSTIERNFKIEIDYYVSVNFTSFQKAINGIGGLDMVVNSNNYDYFSRYFAAELNGMSEAQATDGTHTIHLDGAQALAYARNRSLAGSDFTRTLHQRDLISQFVEHCTHLSITEIHELLTNVLPWVTTNVPKDMLKMMVRNCLTYLSYDVTTARVPCAGSYELANIKGRSVLSVDFASNIQMLYKKIYD